MKLLRSRWWRLVSDEEGLSLIELMMAMFVLSVAILALASVGTTSLLQLRLTRDREQATNAGSAALEHVRAMAYRDIAHAGPVDASDLPGDVVENLDISTSQCVGGEPLVTDSASNDPLSFASTGGDRGAIAVFTFVTWADSDCTTPTNSGLKRAVTLSRFEDSGRVQWVRQETLVTEAGRGLPVPNFRVRPEEAALRITPWQTENEVVRCVEHQIRNLGADDRYEWAVVGFDGTKGTFQSLKEDGQSYRSPGSNPKWTLTAHLQVLEEKSDEDDPDVYTVLDESVMDVPVAGGGFASDSVVRTRDAGIFTVCYEPRQNMTEEELHVEIEVRSRFDRRVLAELDHRVRVTDPGQPLYLLSRNDFEAHARPGQPSRMTGELDQNSTESLARIGSADYTAPEQSDWSTEFNGGVPTVPGVQLRRDAAAPASQRTADWRYQFSGHTSLTGQPQLVIWTAPRSVLTSNVAPAVPLRMRMNVRLDGLHSNEGHDPIWAGVTKPIDYLHSTATWQRHVVDLPNVGTVEFQNNRRLRLRIVCHEDSAEDCNLAYDSNSGLDDAYQSVLYVDLQ